MLQVAPRGDQTNMLLHLPGLISDDQKIAGDDQKQAELFRHLSDNFTNLFHYRTPFKEQ